MAVRAVLDMQWLWNLPNEGWQVAGGARDLNGLSDLEKQLRAPYFIRSLDVTQPHDVESFAQEVKESMGVPDLLVNNAGLINQNAPSLKYLRPNLRRF